MDIVKAIYDMMGKYTYPVLKEDTPRQHVDVFFQVSATCPSPTKVGHPEHPSPHLCPALCVALRGAGRSPQVCGPGGVRAPVMRRPRKRTGKCTKINSKWNGAV